MIDRKAVLVAAAGSCLLWLSGNANASTIQEIVQNNIDNHPGALNSVSDDNFEDITDVNGSGFFDVGDTVTGYLKFNQFLAPISTSIGSGGNSELSGVFHFVVTGMAAAGPGWSYTFAPIAGDGTVIWLYEDATPEALYIAGDKPTTIANMVDGTLLMTLGMTGAAGETFTGSLNGTNHLPTLLTATNSTPLGSSLFAFNRTINGGTADNWVIATTADPFTGRSAEFLGDTALKGPNPQIAFDITSDTNIQFTPVSVPVPGALLGGAVLLAGLGVSRLVRRRA